MRLVLDAKSNDRGLQGLPGIKVWTTAEIKAYLRNR